MKDSGSCPRKWSCPIEWVTNTYEKEWSWTFHMGVDFISETVEDGFGERVVVRWLRSLEVKKVLQKRCHYLFP